MAFEFDVSKTRGPYDRDEERQSLRQRPKGPWTSFERKLYNLVGLVGDRLTPQLPIHVKLTIVQKMLDTYDEGVQAAETERRT